MEKINLSELKIKLQAILFAILKDIENVTKITDLQRLKAKYIGKNSEISQQLRQISQIKAGNNENSKDLKAIAGKLINNTKAEILATVTMKAQTLETEILTKKIKNEKTDVTLPGIALKIGHRNPLYIISEKIISFFTGLGYTIVNGNEVENEEYNFNRLNLVEDHPAREMHDTFYLKNNESKDNNNNRWLLRTHCTNMTARILSQATTKNFKEPSGYLTLGNVYRKDEDDVTHSHQFLQVDGFLIGEKVNFSNLIWTLEKLCQELFGAKSQIRLRPSYFPFTEPSVEVDVSCPICIKKGCSLCKKSGWIEILGAGIIHPNVFKLCNLDPEKVTGFAFGVGIERIAMIKYCIDDIRLFYQNDYRFLKQF